MVVQMQVLSVDSVETAPSLLLSTEARRFLFNVSDGTQRLCMEHHVRLAKLQHVFLTELRPYTVGGLPGMVLTISDTGKPGLHVYGPPRTDRYLKATRHFLHRPDFALKASEVLLSGTKKEIKSYYEDDEVVVYAVAVLKSRLGAKRKLDNNQFLPDSEEQSHVSVSYVVETRRQRGKFLVEKAIALGVPKGKLFGQLHQGKDVTLDNGNVVKSSDCVLPSMPAVACVVVSCPTTAHVDALVNSIEFDRYREINGKTAQVQVQVVFHLGRTDVLKQPKYAAWSRSFGAQARHVLLGHEACAQKTVYRASAKLQAQLHAVFPHAFPSNETQELRDAAEPFSRPVPDAKSLNFTEISSNESESAVSNLVLGESMLSFILAPQARRGFDISNCWQRLDFNTIRQSVPSLVETVTNTLGTDDVLNGRITFLGTGCAIPSKYRNVTGMYLELPTEVKGNDQWAGLMLDCGEGSTGQLYRYAEGDKKRFQELIDRLKCVWISHNHADHHLGLLRLLSCRASSVEPLLVIGPTSLRYWLDEYSALDPTVSGLYTFAENHSFDESDSRFQDDKIYMESARVRAWLREMLNITQFECVPVKHSRQSYAVVVTFNDGAKLAFSGDCRPSEKLAEKAKGAFLLVHEATFEDEMVKEAKDKAHCTIQEAIQVGRQANVRNLVLTHFSQRYPKMAVLSSAFEQNPLNILTAIDLLSLRFRELQQPQLMDVCTRLLDFSDEEADGAMSHSASKE
ncbi:hypothetical protein PPTG_10538 [Plasmopara halstedii]|uniref:ribonuclease Z n=1 Tax=Plasmopara halstedii TaxID=4781 RepID=A0A0P1B0G1_PLAHL|nr:hypothetical protein PPTG_10538 [Plasmopara halstedii]CEG46671.1 hypothetical protein PPTG_10538 [Plasmopara halstedii]|eukprot:XP_024583040.1 hypothetical protein PPTG_10538 [Plasmopara halstedii]